MKRVFIDTGGFIAYLNENELLCEKARDLFQTLSEENVRLCTTDYILDELFLLQQNIPPE